MEISEACSLFSDLTGIRAERITSEKQLAIFARANFFHKSQKEFTRSYLNNIIQDFHDNTIYIMEDLLMIHTIIYRNQGELILIGPYLTRDLTEANIRLLKERYHLNDLNQTDYAAYRANYILVREEELLQGCRALLKRCFPNLEEPQLVHLKSEENQQTESWNYSQKNFESIVNERYRLEREFMQYITDGDTANAVANYRKLHNNVRFMVNIGGTLESSMVSSGITRATVRVAAMNAGLPPVIIDEISGKSSRRIMQCHSREEMYRENERMVQEFTQAIQRYRKRSYSPVIYRAIHLLENHYADALTVEETAEQLGISVSSYISRFKDETGNTPNAYLNQVRMRKARQLLLSTVYTIQQIAESVGIPDGNYFVKCFKKVYGTTPSAYRNNHPQVEENHGN